MLKQRNKKLIYLFCFVILFILLFSSNSSTNKKFINVFKNSKLKYFNPEINTLNKIFDFDSINQNPLNCSLFQKPTYPFYSKPIELYLNKSINFECLNNKSKNKKILLWNKIFKQEEKFDFKCPISKCSISTNNSDRFKSDLILINLNDKSSNLYISDSNTNALIASLVYEPFDSVYNNYSFNLSISYRTDSDLSSFYLRNFFMEFNEKYLRNEIFFTNKTLKSNSPRGLVATIIDDCTENSEHLEFISFLNKYIKVDIYGKCGKKCLQSDCLEFINLKYKFYFVFEKSVCKQYVTDRFFRIFHYDLLPIVLNSLISNQEFYVPKKGFISADMFSSFKSLAEYVKYLDQNPEEYAKYFEWKRRVKFEQNKNSLASILCDLCIKLQLNEFDKKSQINSRNSINFEPNKNCFRLNIQKIKQFNFNSSFVEDNIYNKIKKFLFG